MLPQIALYDKSFAHATSIGNGDLKIFPKYFDWDRTNSISHPIAFYTDQCLNWINANRSEHTENDAIILEPESIAPHLYTPETLFSLSINFNHVFTTKKDVCRNNIHWLPTTCGCWIEPEDQLIYEKDFNLSCIFSGKNFSEGHRLRHSIVKQFGASKIDFVAGKGYNEIFSKLEALAAFRYQIVVENCRCNGYFTEKLIDCLRTGTIPLYWGAPDIGNYFDVKGIYSFNNLEQLSEILDKISVEDYNSKETSIKNNYLTAEQYTSVEDLLWKTYLKELYEQV